MPINISSGINKILGSAFTNKFAKNSLMKKRADESLASVIQSKQQATYNIDPNLISQQQNKFFKDNYFRKVNNYKMSKNAQNLPQEIANENNEIADLVSQMGYRFRKKLNYKGLTPSASALLDDYGNFMHKSNYEDLDEYIDSVFSDKYKDYDDNISNYAAKHPGSNIDQYSTIKVLREINRKRRNE